MMTKSEIIGTTLDQLIDKFYSSLGVFKYVGGDVGKTIVWQNKIDAADKIPDPNEAERTVAITWSELDNAMSVAIFSKHLDVGLLTGGHLADAIITDKRIFEKYRANRRKFIKLKKLLFKAKEHNDNKEFLTKLSTVFPSALDHFLFGE